MPPSSEGQDQDPETIFERLIKNVTDLNYPVTQADRFWWDVVLLFDENVYSVELFEEVPVEALRRLRELFIDRGLAVPFGRGIRIATSLKQTIRPS